MWVKFEDQTPEDPDIEDLSDGAFRLWFAAICYAQRQQTDGFVPANKLSRLVPNYRRTQVQELTRQPSDPDKGPVFAPLSGGFKIRSFEKYNQTAAYWADQAEKAAARKQRYRERNSEREENE